MIIDFHTHAFPSRIVEAAMRELIQRFGYLEPTYDGSEDGLRAYAEQLGVDYCVVLNIATNPRQMKKVNDFAASANHGRIVSFGSIHPCAEDAMEEVDRVKALGLKGVKLHPDYQDFWVDDERFFPLYRKLGELGLITTFHAGQDMGCFEPVRCTPERLARILPLFGGAPVVAAHMGSNYMWHEVEALLCGKDIYFDTAYTYGNMPPEQGRRLTLKHGTDRILLGSDMPWSRTTDEMKYIKSWRLSDTDYAKIYGENGAKLLGL